ncbi:MAG: VOC family protein [Chloroflexi bacterium]|nr:VOC family protein [Chloroflexota bacterium]
MGVRLNHIHLKAPDARRSADWYVEAFGLEIQADGEGPLGGRTVRLQSVDGMTVNISEARHGETLGPGDATTHMGLEHFGFDSADIVADLKRFSEMGAPTLEGPIRLPDGRQIAFLQAPDDVRIELVQPA